jgi:hypothetical protein
MTSATTQAPKMVESIDPAYVTVFRAEMAQRKVDLSLYNLRYSETELTYIISTKYKNKEPGLRGSDPVHKDYSVEINKSDKRIIRVSLAR